MTVAVPGCWVWQTVHTSRCLPGLAVSFSVGGADHDRAGRDGEHGPAAVGRHRVQDVRPGPAVRAAAGPAARRARRERRAPARSSGRTRTAGVVTGSSSGSLTVRRTGRSAGTRAPTAPGESGHALARGAGRPRCGTGCRRAGCMPGTTRARWRPAPACAPARRGPRRPAARRPGAARSLSRVSWRIGARRSRRGRCWPAPRARPRRPRRRRLPVCSRVRPTRDCRPNSITASNSRRRRTRVRTSGGHLPSRSRCQNGANSPVRRGRAG